MGAGRRLQISEADLERLLPNDEEAEESADAVLRHQVRVKFFELLTASRRDRQNTFPVGARWHVVEPLEQQTTPLPTGSDRGDEEDRHTIGDDMQSASLPTLSDGVEGPGRNSSRSRTSGANINTSSNIPSQRCQLRVELLEGNGFKHDGSHQVEVRVDGHAPVRSQWASSDDDALASMDSFGNVLLGAGKRFPGPPLFFRNILRVQKM
eukprot:g13290.t1